MRREDISEAVGNIENRYIQEAANYTTAPKRTPFYKRTIGRGIAAAVLTLCFILVGINVLSPSRDRSAEVSVTAYARGKDGTADVEIPRAGAVIRTGTISDSGEMTGHPLMFYLTGKDVKTVRFSCKNQQIDFRDWTGKRDEYGEAENFTVNYGKNEEEYYYLTIDWVPNRTIEQLTDDDACTIATLPAELREDIIVMEVTFGNGRKATKAITVSLFDDGTFYAKFDDYQIDGTDSFIQRTDSKAIPRNELYSQEGSASTESNSAITSQISGSKPSSKQKRADLLAAKKAANAYYSQTVFTVISMKLKSQTEKKISFSVRTSKGGIIQKPDRTITIKLKDGKWKIVGEGDYLIPNLALPDTDNYQIGKYGRMRRTYLKEHRKVLYTTLVTEGTLFEHLAEIDQSCNRRMEIIVSAMAKQENVTESLKAADQMEWVRRMSSIRSRAEEIVLTELVYA